MPIIVINRNPQSELKERAYQSRVDGIIEQNELEQCQIAIYNIINRIDEQNALENFAQKSKL